MGFGIWPKDIYVCEWRMLRVDPETERRLPSSAAFNAAISFPSVFLKGKTTCHTLFNVAQCAGTVSGGLIHAEQRMWSVF